MKTVARIVLAAFAASVLYAATAIASMSAHAADATDAPPSTPSSFVSSSIFLTHTFFIQTSIEITLKILGASINQQPMCWHI